MPVPAGVRSYYQKQVGLFHVHGRAASRFLAAEAIHELRVVLKRLRAFFQLVNAIHSRSFKEEAFAPAQKLLRSAGRVRNIQLLEERVLRAAKESGLSLSEFYNDLKINEKRTGQKFRRAAVDFKKDFFESAWKKIEASFEALPPAAFRDAAWSRLAALVSEIRESKPRRSAGDRLHLLRIKSKEARYELEVIRAGSRQGRNVSELNLLLRNIHQALGRWHDDEVVLETLRKFRRERQAGPYFSYKSYPEFATLLERSKKKNLEEFEASWVRFLKFMATRGLVLFRPGRRRAPENVVASGRQDARERSFGC